MSAEILSAQWPTSSPAERLALFQQCVTDAAADLPCEGPYTVTEDPGADSVSQLGPGSYGASPNLFSAATSESAEVALAVIVGNIFDVCQREWNEKRLKWEKERRKEQQKRDDKLAKEGKPKGNSSKAGAYWAKYYEKMYGPAGAS